MSLTILLPLLVAVLGALVYLLAARPETKEMGRLCFFIGVLWAVYQVMGKALHF